MKVLKVGKVLPGTELKNEFEPNKVKLPLMSAFLNI